MANIVTAEEIAEEVNYWRKYRGQSLIANNVAAIQSYYRIHNFDPAAVQRPAPVGIPQIPPFNTPPSKLPLALKIPAEQKRQSFMNQAAVPGLPTGAGNWKGVRFLGDGSNAWVGLWEWTGAAGGQKSTVNKIVVKQLKDDRANGTINVERFFNNYLDPVKSRHIVKILAPATKLTHGSDEGLGKEFDGVYTRLYMEFCENGCLYDLLEKRIYEQKPFSELTLWLIFECLFDAIHVLDLGGEMYEDDTIQGGWGAPNDPDWTHIVHFDIQPGNVFLGGRDRRHINTPICKLGDFGYAAFVEWEDTSIEAYRRNGELRGRGTHGYIPPEQYTERWDYADWHSRIPRLPGCFGPWSMLWSVACMMSQLATLDFEPPDYKTPFQPQFDINGDQSQDWTFGWKLQAYPYSKKLKDLIYECLYETPEYRPKFLDLRKRIAEGVQDALEADAPMEPWADFVMADPVDILPPHVVAPPVVPPPVIPPAAGPVPGPPPGGPGYIPPPPPLLARPPPPPPPALVVPAVIGPLPRTAKCMCTALKIDRTRCKNTWNVTLPYPRFPLCHIHRR